MALSVQPFVRSDILIDLIKDLEVNCEQARKLYSAAVDIITKDEVANESR